MILKKKFKINQYIDQKYFFVFNYKRNLSFALKIKIK